MKLRVLVTKDKYFVYNKFLNLLMKRGLKNKAEKGLLGALAFLKKGYPEVRPIDLLNKIIENVMPHVEIRSRKVGGRVYRVPMVVKYERDVSFAIKWILDEVNGSMKRRGIPLDERLYMVFTNVLEEKGKAFNKKLEVQKLVTENRANLRFLKKK